MREKALSCVRKKQHGFCNSIHLGNLVLATLANLVNLLNLVLAILVHLAPFWLTGFTFSLFWFILANWVYVLAILVHFDQLGFHYFLLIWSKGYIQLTWYLLFGLILVHFGYTWFSLFLFHLVNMAFWLIWYIRFI